MSDCEDVKMKTLSGVLKSYVVAEVWRTN